MSDEITVYYSANLFNRDGHYIEEHKYKIRYRAYDYRLYVEDHVEKKTKDHMGECLLSEEDYLYGPVIIFGIGDLFYNMVYGEFKHIAVRDRLFKMAEKFGLFHVSLENMTPEIMPENFEIFLMQLSDYVYISQTGAVEVQINDKKFIFDSTDEHRIFYYSNMLSFYVDYQCHSFFKDDIQSYSIRCINKDLTPKKEDTSSNGLYDEDILDLGLKELRRSFAQINPELDITNPPVGFLAATIEDKHPYIFMKKDKDAVVITKDFGKELEFDGTSKTKLLRFAEILHYYLDSSIEYDDIQRVDIFGSTKAHRKRKTGIIIPWDTFVTIMTDLIVLP